MLTAVVACGDVHRGMDTDGPRRGIDASATQPCPSVYDLTCDIDIPCDVEGYTCDYDGELDLTCEGGRFYYSYIGTGTGIADCARHDFAVSADL